MTATHEAVKAAELPSEAKLRACVDALGDLREFKLDDLVDAIMLVLDPPEDAPIAEQDRMFTAAEFGRLAYFSSSLRHSGQLLVGYADKIEQHFYRLEDRTES